MSKARSLADLGNAYDDGALSNRNLIINGAMQVAQRGTQTGHASGYTLDRWNVRTTGSARFTVSQDTDVPSGQGFGSSIKIDVTTADTDAGTGDFGAFRTILEGQNVQHICKGTSAAKKLTLSFWVKSTVTGTYTTELYDADNSRQVSLSYNVDTSDTWEQKVLVFPADTVGAFTNDANGSLYIQFGLAMGSDYSGGTLSTTWTVSNGPDRFAGQVNAFSSTSNNIYFTGVQLEQGDTATPFEHRSFGDELARCQRYYWRWQGNSSDQTSLGAGFYNSTTNALIHLPHPVRMRAKPTGSTGSSTDIRIGVNNENVTGTVSELITDDSEYSVLLQITTSSKSTGASCRARLHNSANAFIAYDAEL